MKYLGDFADDATVYTYFSTNDSSGGRVAFSATLEAADFEVIKDGNATGSTAGITVSNDFDSKTGIHKVEIDMSADAFYATGSDYALLLYPNDETVDSQNVAAVLATWSCENRFDEVDVTKWLGSIVFTPGTSGVPKVDLHLIQNDAQSATDFKDFADSGYDPAQNGVNLNMSQGLPASPSADTTGDAMKQATREEAPKKNQALNDIAFEMVSSTDNKTGLTGLTVSAQVSKDGGSFAAAAGSVSEIGNGVYVFDATAADMNADTVILYFTATGANPVPLTLSTVA